MFLLFLSFHAILSPVTKPEKTKVLQRVAPIPGEKKMIEKTSTGFLSYPLRRVCS